MNSVSTLTISSVFIGGTPSKRADRFAAGFSRFAIEMGYEASRVTQAVQPIAGPEAVCAAVLAEPGARNGYDRLAAVSERVITKRWRDQPTESTPRPTDSHGPRGVVPV